MSKTTVRPPLLPSGVLVCPVCGKVCSTPRTPNPHNNDVVEKMILKEGGAACPHCPAVHEIDREVARWHNAIWYADDPAYVPGVHFDPVVPPPRIRTWTWRNATASIRDLAPLVGGLRSAACRLSHLRLVARRDSSTRVIAGDIGDAESEGVRLKDEIEAAGVLLHAGRCGARCCSRRSSIGPASHRGLCISSGRTQATASTAFLCTAPRAGRARRRHECARPGSGRRTTSLSRWWFVRRRRDRLRSGDPDVPPGVGVTPSSRAPVASAAGSPRRRR